MKGHIKVKFWKKRINIYSDREKQIEIKERGRERKKKLKETE